MYHFIPIKAHSLKQVVAQVEEEFETVSAHELTQRPSLTSLSSVWVFESLSSCAPKRLLPDPQATLFQLAENRLLQPLFLFVEVKHTGEVQQHSNARETWKHILQQHEKFL